MAKLVHSVDHEARYRRQRISFKDPLMKTFFDDMEKGINVGSKKGSRSFARLYTLRNRLRKWEEWSWNTYKKKLTELTYREIQELYHNLSSGKIKKQNGEEYKAYGNYGQDIKTFWGWYVRYMRREKNKQVVNITEDIDTSSKNGERDFHYMDFEQFKELIQAMPEQHRALLWFMFDSGIRPDKELLNIRVSDLTTDPVTKKYFVHIRPETAKTFGRKFKLMLCTDIIKKHIKENKLSGNDLLFDVNRAVINKTLGLTANKLFGFGKAYTVKEKRKNGKTFNRTKVSGGVHLYTIRHCSACYWVGIYKKDADMKKRFGWKKSDKIFYYTHFLGLDDNMTEEDLYTEQDKSNMQKEMEELQNQMKSMQETLKKVLLADENTNLKKLEEKKEVWKALIKAGQ